MMKISKLQSPAIAGVVRKRNVKEAIAEIRNLYYDGANMIDLHISCLENPDEESLREIISSSPLPILALNYNVTYGGNDAGFDEEKRVEYFLKSINAGARGIDIQGYTFDIKSKEGFFGDDIYSFTKGNPKEIVTDKSVIEKQCELIDCVHQKGAEVLLSCHPGIFMDSTQVTELALFMEKRNPDIIKIVTIASNEDELAESFKTMITLKKEVKTTVTYHAGGKAGNLSRFVNPMLGSHMIFVNGSFDAGSNFDQPRLKEMRTAVDCISKIL